MFICESFMEVVADKLNIPVHKLRVILLHEFGE